MDRLYLVTRRDLPAGAQAAQLCHALRQFTEEHPATDREWFTTSNTIVLLAVADERELAALRDRAIDRDLRSAAFREPDLADALTAIALEPRAARLCRDVPLAFAGP